jgi:hypothetical protein
VLSLIWVRPYGMTGVAMGTVVASLIDYPLHLRYLSRHVGLHLGAFVREVVLPVYPLLLLPAALAWAARIGGLTRRSRVRCSRSSWPAPVLDGVPGADGEPRRARRAHREPRAHVLGVGVAGRPTRGRAGWKP